MSPCRADTSSRRGFTLIELLATSALAALLVLATLSVIASVGRTEAAFGRHVARDPWPPALLATIRWDLTSARTLETSPDRILLTGFGHLDPQTLSPSHRPTRVEYSIQTVAGRRWLVRTQTATHAGSSESAWRAPVAADVQTFLIERPLRPGVLEDVNQKKVPAELKVTIRSSQRQVPDLIQTIHLHRP